MAGSLDWCPRHASCGSTRDLQVKAGATVSGLTQADPCLEHGTEQRFPRWKFLPLLLLRYRLLGGLFCSSSRDGVLGEAALGLPP